MGIGPAIGLMLMNIGFGSNAGVFVFNDDGSSSQFFAMRDFFGALTANSARDTMTTGYGMMVLTVVTMFIGLFAIVAMSHKKIKGSVLYGMLIASVVYWAGEAIFFKTNPFASLATASFVPPFADMAKTTLFKLNFKGFAEIGWFTIITLVITFCIIDMFDTIGTLVGTASRANMLDKDGNMPGSVPRTSTIALTNATLRYGLQIAASGLEEAAKANKAIALGVNCYDGKIVNKNVSKALDIEYVDLAELI